tara:strand:+ start:19446 stop:19868 length:423 start_codon:yes stop_codon:yes gene_type:complete
VKQTILIFSALIVAVLCLFQLSKYALLFGNTNIDAVIAMIALVFFAIGAYLNKKSFHHQKVVLNEGKIDHKKITQLGISKREYEVLLQVSQGLSNKEIALRLSVSESTIKTHVSNILLKLDAKRRTQAIQKAKEHQIIAL